MRLAVVLLILGIVLIAAHVWGLVAPGPANWGVHHYSYLPSAWLAAGFALALILFLAAQGSFRALASPGARPAVWAPITAAAAGALFWLGRERSHFLGDGLVWSRALAEGRLLGHNEPAAAWGLFALHRAAGGPEPTVLLAAVSAVCGALFVLLTIVLARAAAPDAGGRGLVFGFVVVAGFTRLFYGHIEIYAVAAVVLAAYLAGAVLHLRGRVGPWAPALLFALCVPTHVLAVALLPSLVYLLARGPAPAWQRGAWGAAAVVLAAAGLFLGWRDPGALGAVFSRHLRELLPLAGDLGNRAAYHLFDLGHLLAFVQEQLFLGPAVAACALILWAARGRGAGRDEVFLLWAGIPWWVLSFLYNREIGAARDWGAFALASVPLAVFAGLALARHPWRRDAGGLAAAASGVILGVSAFHTVGVVAVDLEPDRGLQRFAGLFGPTAPVSGFARAYAFEELGNHYLAAGDFGNAEVAFATALQADSTNTRLAGNLGSVRLVTGNREGAIEDLERAVSRSPENATLHYQLAGAYTEAGRFDEAVAEYGAAVERNPGFLEAYLAHAALVRDLGDTQAAAALLETARTRFPGSGQVKLNLGRVYEQAGRTDEAITEYREGLALQPDDTAAAFNLARLYMARKQPAEAAAVLQDLVRQSPGDVEAWINLGAALDGTGDAAGSVEAFRQANRLDPGRPEPYFNLARSHMLAQRPDLAVATLENLASRDSTSDAGLRARAIIRRLRAEAAAADTVR